MQRVAAAFAAYERDRDGVLAELNALEAELAAPRAAAAEPLPALEPGPDEVLLRDALCQSSCEARLAGCAVGPLCSALMCHSYWRRAFVWRRGRAASCMTLQGTVGQYDSG